MFYLALGIDNYLPEWHRGKLGTRRRVEVECTADGRIINVVGGSGASVSVPIWRPRLDGER